MSCQKLSAMDWSYLLDGATSLVQRMTEALSESSVESVHKLPKDSGIVLRLQLGDTEWNVSTDTEGKLWICARDISNSSATQ